MKRIFFILLILAIFSSCSSLTKTQIASIRQFGTATEEFSAYPSKILTELADIRVKRGLFFSNTLTSPQLKVEELDSIYSQKKYDYKMAAKADISFKILEKYGQYLVLLSSEDYSNAFGSQSLQFGVGLDSLIHFYNRQENTANLPKGLGNFLGSLLSSGGQRFISARQAKEIQKFVPRADTLISVMTGNLLEFLESSEINDLIKQEDRMVRRDYLTYLQQEAEKNTFPSQQTYLNLKTRLDAAKNLRQQSIDATRELRQAHKELVQLVENKKKLSEVWQELQSFYAQLNSIKETLQALAKNQSL